MAQSSFATALAIMGGAGLLAGSAGEAVAATTVPQTLPYSVTASDTSNPASQTLNFNQFNSALGTLTEVDISVSNERESGSVSITDNHALNFGGGEGGTASQEASFAIKDTVLTEMSTGDGTSASCFTNGCSNSNGATISPLATDPYKITSANASEFALFLGASTVPLTASITGAFIDSCVDSSSGGCSFTNTATMAGSLSVQYTYTATASEPASLALLTAGMIGLAFVVRRQRPGATA